MADGSAKYGYVRPQFDESYVLHDAYVHALRFEIVSSFILAGISNPSLLSLKYVQ